jgi:hypothetical protein
MWVCEPGDAQGIDAATMCCDSQGTAEHLWITCTCLTYHPTRGGYLVTEREVVAPSYVWTLEDARDYREMWVSAGLLDPQDIADMEQSHNGNVAIP